MTLQKKIVEKFLKELIGKNIIEIVKVNTQMVIMIGKLHCISVMKNLIRRAITINL